MSIKGNKGRETMTSTHKEEQEKIDNLTLALQKHCTENELRDRMNDEKLEKLMPLVDLIPTLTQIAEDQKAAVNMGRRFLKAVGVISSVIGLLYLIFCFWKEIK